MKSNFILRTVSRDGKYPTVNNQILSPHYNIIHRHDRSLAEWKKVIQQYYPKVLDGYVPYYKAILIYASSILLCADKEYYIMTESGKTYERVIFQ